MFLSSRKSGFTLIELLVVIAIIGVLASILLPTVGLIRRRVYASNATQTVGLLTQACLVYQREEPAHRLPDIEMRTVGGIQHLCLTYMRADGLEPNGAIAKLDQRGLMVFTGNKQLLNGVLLDPWGNPYVLATNRPTTVDPKTGVVYWWWPTTPLDASGNLDATKIADINRWNWDQEGTTLAVPIPAKSEDPSLLKLAGAARTKGKYPYVFSFGAKGVPTGWPFASSGPPAGGVDGTGWLFVP